MSNCFIVGDRVAIKNDVFKEGHYTHGYSGEGTVAGFRLDGKSIVVEWDEDNDRWEYHPHDLVLVAKASEVKDLPKIQNLDEAYEKHKEYSDGTYKPQKIKSDGGSSSYYDLPISDKLMSKLMERYYNGEPYIKTEEIIDDFFGNDFDFGTLFKSLVRGYAQTLGEGKAGNDINYEMNKVVYSANKIKEKGE